MYSRFHYILIFLIGVILYLVYLIAYYKFTEFQVDNYEASIIAKNQEIEYRNSQKELLEEYIHTNAYQTQVAKATQNKQLPGEEVVNVIRQEDIDGNKDLDLSTVLASIKQQKDDPTANLSNPEKWRYLIENGIPRQ